MRVCQLRHFGINVAPDQTRRCDGKYSYILKGLLIVSNPGAVPTLALRWWSLTLVLSQSESRYRQDLPPEIRAPMDGGRGACGSPRRGFLVRREVFPRLPRRSRSTRRPVPDCRGRGKLQRCRE